MTVFETELFESSPPEGLYNVDIGVGDIYDFGHLHTFADMNADKYTDIVTVMKDSNQVQILTYDAINKMFKPGNSFIVDGCTNIHNVAVGRSS